MQKPKNDNVVPLFNRPQEISISAEEFLTSVLESIRKDELGGKATKMILVYQTTNVDEEGTFLESRVETNILNIESICYLLKQAEISIFGA